MEVNFFCSNTGKNHVGDSIKELSPKTVKKIMRTLERLKKYGAHTLMSTTDQCVKLKGYENLWELRVNCEKISYRIFFVIINMTCTLLHLFKKKTNHTPQRHIDIALARINSLKLSKFFN